MNRVWLYWLPALTHMALIFYLSSRERFPVDAPPVPFIDKFVHLALFGTLAFLFLWGWMKGRIRSTPPRVFLYCIGFVAFYGVTDEVHQMFVPNRNPDIGDWIADVLGAILVCGVVLVRNIYLNAFGIEVEERSSENA